MQLMTIGSSQTMSSQEISDLVESRHDKVKQSIERLAFRGVIQLPPLGEVKNHLGQTVSVYLIEKRDTYVIVAQLSPEFTARLVDRWQELENGNGYEIPKTLSQALRLAADKQEIIEQQALQLEQAKPKVEFVDSYVESEGSYNFTQVCKMLGAKQKEFRELLVRHRIMYKTNNSWTPYADHMHNENFVVKTGTSPGGFSFTHAYFTPKGFAYVSRLWRLENAPAFRLK